MPPRIRLDCLCGCGQQVSRKKEKSHLELKHMRPEHVPKIIQNRRLHSQAPPLGPLPPVAGALDEMPPAGDLPPNLDAPLPLPIDHTELWKRVLSSRFNHGANSGNLSAPSSHRSESFFSAGFRSIMDSDASAQPEYVSEVSYDPTTHGVDPGMLVREKRLVQAAIEAPNSLSSSNMDDIETFDVIVQENILVRTYHALQEQFCLKRSHSALPSLKGLRTRITALSGLKPKDYSCCKNSCICFAGPFDELVICPECNTPRNDAAGSAWNTFTYLPVIPQLRSAFCCRETSQAMRYRAEYPENSDNVGDVFDAKLYKELKATNVVIDGVEQPYKYCQGPRDVVLGASTNGMCPFKRRKKSCWPIILINYNLPPSICNHLKNLMCVGVIPGPHSPKCLGSFLWPLIEELLELAAGITTVDVLTEELFVLRAYLLAIFGDIPVVTKLLEFIGHNGRYPCRFCLVRAIQGITLGGGTHLYCPLHRTDGSGIDPRHLPMRTHEASLESGFAVLNAATESAQSNLATESGIKGVSAFARLGSVSIPSSFPIDIMHLVWTNLIPQLVRLWTNDFNRIGSGSEDYIFDEELWNLIGDITENSGSTIPSNFGCRVPNVTKPTHFIAESWSLFATQLAPSILRRRFRNPKYYVHFVQLIKLLNQCTALSMPRSELPNVREGFAKWVEDFERIYYQYNPDRLQTCPVNVHYLLHIADSIENVGPVWCYWAFPMERFCSFVGAAVKSRRRPFANIARRIRDTAQLQVIRNIYGLHSYLTFNRDQAVKEDEIEGADRLVDYPRAQLLAPRSQALSVTPPLGNKIAIYLATSFGVSTTDAKNYIPDRLKQWGRIQIADGGDLIHARGYHKLRNDERDSSFVRYELLVDRNAHRPRAPERLERVSQYGQLERVFALALPPQSIINPEQKARILLLALIREAPFHVETTYQYPVIWYEGELGTGEVVDARTVQCAVGRIPDKKRYWIIDKSADCEASFPMFD